MSDLSVSIFLLFLVVVVFVDLGTAIFFEFKHYKPKKDIVSTKCFAFMEQDEINPGPACIEL